MDIREAAVALGRQTSERKKRTARQNGKLGGRPKVGAGDVTSNRTTHGRFAPMTFRDLTHTDRLVILRYPGGKAWLLPMLRAFVRVERPKIFIEPYAGGATIGLSLLHQDLVDELVMVERDPRVCALWRRALQDPSFADEVRTFRCSRPNVEDVAAHPERDLAMWTLIKNRCGFGGMLDSGLLNKVDGRGLKNRWNVTNLYYALRQVRALSGRITLIEGDGIQSLRKLNSVANAAFIDPPYPGNESPGRRIYRYHKVDHAGLFAVLSSWRGRWCASYEDHAEVVAMAKAHEFKYTRVAMRTRSQKRKRELLIWGSQHQQLDRRIAGIQTDMSKSNQRKIDCYHESGHAVMAWIEGVEITESRLVPEDEPGKHSATTTYGCPGVNPEDWTLDQIASRMRIALAGMEGEKRGPLPVSIFEQAYAKRQGEQHCIQAMQYAKQFGGTRIPEAGIPTLAVSAEKDVIEVFRHACVVRCVEALARELLRRERIAGPDVEAFIASRITEEQRATIRRECCLTTAKEVRGDSPTT